MVHKMMKGMTRIGACKPGPSEQGYAFMQRAERYGAKTWLMMHWTCQGRGTASVSKMH